MSGIDATPPAGPPRLASASLVLGLVAVVAWALPRAVQPGDAGEFATILLRGGVPHPPGYPWMRMLGPVAALAHGMGLPAATAAALPCALLGVAGWSWIAHVAARVCSWPIAFGTAAFVASAHVVVLHVDDAEVWGPLVFAAAGLLHLAETRTRAPWQVGAAFGAALAVHLTAVWLLPLVVHAAWPCDGARARALARALLGGVAGTLLGLSIFATLAIGDPEAPWRWGALDHASGVLRHVLRSDYGTFSLSLHDADPEPLAQLGRAAGSWVRAWSAGLLEHPAWSLALLGAIGVGVRLAWPRERPGLGLAIASAWLLSGVVFPLLHDIDPGSAFGGWILERFDILPLALSVVPLSVALAAVARALRPGAPRRLAQLTAVALLAKQLATTAELGVPADDDAIEVYARDVLRTPEPGAPAIVLGTDDHRSFAILFAQAVLGEGADVIYIDASLLAHPWYRAMLRRRMPALPDEDKPVRLLVALWSTPEHRAIPVYLANDFSQPSTTLPRVPEGVLWRVLPPAEPGVAELDASPDAVVARHVAARARLVGPPAAAHSPFAADLAAAWAEPDARLRAALAHGGRDDLLAAVGPAAAP